MRNLVFGKETRPDDFLAATGLCRGRLLRSRRPLRFGSLRGRSASPLRPRDGGLGRMVPSAADELAVSIRAPAVEAALAALDVLGIERELVQLLRSEIFEETQVVVVDFDREVSLVVEGSLLRRDLLVASGDTLALGGDELLMKAGISIFCPMEAGRARTHLVCGTGRGRGRLVNGDRQPPPATSVMSILLAHNFESQRLTAWSAPGLTSAHWSRRRRRKQPRHCHIAHPKRLIGICSCFRN